MGARKMTSSAVVGTFLVIFMSCCTPSRSVLHMCRNDTETGEVVHLYRLNGDGGPSDTDCHCKIRPFQGDRVGIFFNVTYIEGCQYSLNISRNNSKRYVNCDSNLPTFYYNIPTDDEITLGILTYLPSATDGLIYTAKINATGSNVTVTCNTAEYFPVITRSTTSTTPSSSSGSVYTSQSPLTTYTSPPRLSTMPYDSTSTPRNTKTTSLGTILSTMSYRSTSRSGNIISTLPQPSTSSSGPTVSSIKSYQTTENIISSTRNTGSRPTVPTLPASTTDSYRHQPGTNGSAENGYLAIGVALGGLAGGIVIGVLLVLGFQCIRKKKKETPDYEIPNFSNDDHTYAQFSQRSREPSVILYNVPD